VRPPYRPFAQFVPDALLYGDASLGALIDGLRMRGLAENTLWIIY